MKHFIIFFAILIGSTLCGQTNIELGGQAPEIVVTDWLKHQPKASSFKKKFIVLDFWATWCKPCLDAVPHMNALRRKFPHKDLLFIALTSEPPALATSVFDRVNFEVSVASDVSRKTEINFGNGISGLSRYPMTVLIDNENIVRWIGSPSDLTEEMVARFLEAGQQVDPSAGAEMAIDKDYEPKYISGHDFYEFVETDSPEVLVNVFELDEVPGGKPIGTVVRGSHAHFDLTTLPKFFEVAFPGIKLVVPTQLYSRTYGISFYNPKPDRASNRAILREIFRQAGYTATFSTGSAQKHTLTIVNPNKLAPTQSTQRWPSCKPDEFNSYLCQKMKLTELADELNKLTDDQWIYEGRDRKRYDFELFLGETEALKSALKAYGVRMKSKPIEVEVVTVQ